MMPEPTQPDPPKLLPCPSEPTDADCLRRTLALLTQRQRDDRLSLWARNQALAAFGGIADALKAIEATVPSDAPPTDTTDRIAALESWAKVTNERLDRLDAFAEAVGEHGRRIRGLEADMAAVNKGIDDLMGGLAGEPAEAEGGERT